MPKFERVWGRGEKVSKLRSSRCEDWDGSLVCWLERIPSVWARRLGELNLKKWVGLFSLYASSPYILWPRHIPRTLLFISLPSKILKKISHCLTLMTLKTFYNFALTSPSHASTFTEVPSILAILAYWILSEYHVIIHSFTHCSFYSPVLESSSLSQCRA